MNEEIIAASSHSRCLCGFYNLKWDSHGLVGNRSLKFRTKMFFTNSDLFKMDWINNGLTHYEFVISTDFNGLTRENSLNIL